MNHDPRVQPAAANQPKITAEVAETMDIQTLLGGAREIRLRHCQDEYRLRITRNNKLILTK